MKYKSDQEGFWAEDYSKEYIKKNSQFDDITLWVFKKQ